MGENSGQKENNYWIVETYEDDSFIVSVMSKAEADAMKKMDDIEDWMIESTDEVSEEEMEERAKDRGYEHDPW